MKLFLFLCIFLIQTLFSVPTSDENLKKMIGHMLIVGFDKQSVDENSQLIKDINKYELGGVILFDIFYNDRSKQKNISSPEQLQKLTSKLQNLTHHKLLISVDQEGGRVARLKPSYGFAQFPSAKEVSNTSFANTQKIYSEMSHMLQTHGFNCNFAPVVDLEINPKNKVIVGLERSFGTSNKSVTSYAKILIKEQKKAGIISVLKHFPGHGSSLGDSHLGFVNITDTWDKKELEPYKSLIATNSVEMIMTAHVFNEKLDATYPATLSHNVNTKLLRDEMQYKGVVVSDDLQMKAISSHYTLKETVTLAINAGVDILLFGNQLANQNTDELIETIYTEVKNGAIPYKRILESNKRIQVLHE
ncbi:MAG: beta-N-acetylhexosaminidase [Sulfurimonas sp.]|uniref:glycoside hydrolase family 3 protein n=1 Tax=Sulfurimonas sp. TaxID=2022749 RepID=UPI0039E2C8DE